MMITATLYFENGVDVGGLVNDLQGLPEPIRPVYFAEDEGKIIKSNLLSNEGRFRDFQEENLTGFFLYAKNKSLFDVSTRRVGYAVITLWLAEGLPSELVVTFLRSLAGHKPVFGFACDEDEYDHRNRHYITIGKNHIEAWIGRKLEKYIPGVYWHTFLSDGLLTQHGVKLADLSVEAVTTETLGDGSLHLLKFFESPEDWQTNVERLDNLCERVSGIFSRSSVEKAVAGITNFPVSVGLWGSRNPTPPYCYDARKQRKQGTDHGLMPMDAHQSAGGNLAPRLRNIQTTAPAAPSDDPDVPFPPRRPAVPDRLGLVAALRGHCIGRRLPAGQHHFCGPVLPP